MLWLWVLVLFKALQVHASSPSQAYCPMSREAHGIVKSQENITLVGHVIATIRAPSMATCSQRCLANHKCISVNYELTYEQCELNDYGVQRSEDTTHNPKFQRKDGFVYSQMRTPNFLSLVDRCADGSFGCANGGSCQFDCSTLRPQCNCPPGFFGQTWQDNECSPNPCQHAGTCEVAVEGYKCTCVAGYMGADCQTNINECSTRPCLNGGTCVDNVNGYTCNCTAGFTGENCNTNINECQSVTCLNGATCEDGINSYTCKCVPGFAGDHCETEVNCVLNFTDRSVTNYVSTTLGMTFDTYSEFTFCMWYSLVDVHRATFLSYADGIVSSSATSHFSIGINTDGNVEFGFKGKTYKATENKLPQSFWHSFCIEWIGTEGKVRLAIDGVGSGDAEKYSGLKSADVYGGGKLVIGQYQTCKGECFNDTLSYKGMLTEVTFWNSRIGDLAFGVYHSGACLSNDGANDGGLQMYWRQIISQTISGNVNAICPSPCQQAESCALKYDHSVANSQSTVTLGFQGETYSEMSVCAWFYLDNPNNHNTIVSYTTGDESTSFSIVITKTGQVEFSFQGHKERSLTSDFVIPASNWTGMCFDWNEHGKLQVFKNGSAGAVWSKTVASSWERAISGGGKLVVGHYLISLIEFDTSRSFQGMIAEVNIWDSTLGSSKAAKYFNDGQCINSGNTGESEIIKWANLLPRPYSSGVSKVCPAPCKALT